VEMLTLKCLRGGTGGES